MTRLTGVRPPDPARRNGPGKLHTRAPLHGVDIDWWSESHALRDRIQIAVNGKRRPYPIYPDVFFQTHGLTVGDYHDGWLTIDKAVKGKGVTSPIRGTKTRRSKRLPVSEDIAEWIKKHVDGSGRLRRDPLFPNPRTGIWPHKALQAVWNRAVKSTGLPSISLYEGAKHSFATDAIRRGVPERHLQRFLGHASVEATRRYARLADNAMLEALRPRGQAGDKAAAKEAERNQDVRRGPSRTRTWDRPVMSRLL